MNSLDLTSSVGSMSSLAAEAELILSLPSQDPKYRRCYAQYVRQAQSKNPVQTPEEIVVAFAGGNATSRGELFAAWLRDGKSFKAVALQMKLSRVESERLDDVGAYRTRHQMVKSGEYESAEQIDEIINQKTLLGFPHVCAIAACFQTVPCFAALETFDRQLIIDSLHVSVSMLGAPLLVL